MYDVITKLRIKHTIYTAITAGVILLALLSGFCGLLAASADYTASKTMDAALQSATMSRPQDMGSSRCFCFYVENGSSYAVAGYDTDLNFYTQNGYNVIDILNAAVNTRDGRFEVDGTYFAVSSAVKGNAVYYAVYDRTSDRNMLLSTVIITVCLYLIAMIVIILLSYLYSSKTTAPVKDALDRQRDLVANASHELKTPLTIIATNLSVMKLEPTSTIEDNAKWISSINGQIERMDGLIKNMLELSKLEQSELPKTVINFSEIVEGACLEFEPVCFEKGAHILSDIKSGVYVYGDTASLERLVIILLDNALKYSGENGKVGCRLTSDKNKIRLTVMNTGAAISSEEQKHVFDRFYRSDGARGNPDGNSFGLGLSIAQATVAAHDGNITCRGVESKGSVFEVTLPLPTKKQYSKKQLADKQSADKSDTKQLTEKRSKDNPLDVLSAENAESVQAENAPINPYAAKHHCGDDNSDGFDMPEEKDGVDLSDGADKAFDIQKQSMKPDEDANGVTDEDINVSAPDEDANGVFNKDEDDGSDVDKK